jgi:hypothetical protein
MTPPLQEAFVESERARLFRWIPALHLTSAFRLATRWQNLALALFGVMLLAGGRFGLSQFVFSEPTAATVTQSNWMTSLSRHLATDAGAAKGEIIWPWEQGFLSPSLPTTREFISQSRRPEPLTLLSPLLDLVRPVSRILERRLSWSGLADAVLEVLLVVLVGSLVGGAISRRVALEFAGEGEWGLRATLREAIRECPTTCGAPAIALVGIALLTIAGRLIAWTSSIPGLDSGVIPAALWGLLLVIGLLTAMIVFGVAIAWPLMVTAHSIEQTDAFDALNRAYNYVFVRPWYALSLTFAGLAYGTVVLAFLLFLLGATVHLTERLAAGPISDSALAAISTDAPPLVASGSVEATAETSLARRLGGMWNRGLAAVLTAFVYSFFWTAATLVYVLLRKSVDATDIREVFVAGKQKSVGDPPLAGAAAVARREAEQAGSPAVAPPVTLKLAGNAEAQAPAGDPVP